MAADEVIRGSIPAHAGEPRSSTAPRGRAWVYPRPRGGADLVAVAGLLQGGLSPPTRGSQRLERAVRAVRGSIPAHAGEPLVLMVEQAYLLRFCVEPLPRIRGP